MTNEIKPEEKTHAPPVEPPHPLEHPHVTIGDRVWMDTCRELVAIVTGLLYRDPETYQVECSWIANSKPENHWIESWRVHPLGGQ